MRDLHELPKVRDSWTHLYVEHCRVEQDGKAIMIEDVRGSVPIPCANLSLLMLGPGTTITHAAMRSLADSGCLTAWCGEHGIRFYAQGMGETRSSKGILHQARLWADDNAHMAVVKRMYQMRFDEPIGADVSLQQIRGMEGARVRQAYQVASQQHGVRWEGRNYDRRSWRAADPINRALSVANSCLYGICHAAIVAAGYSPALGFIHTGKMLSFVYDIADLYKTATAVPVAFRLVANEGAADLDGKVRRACRDEFHSKRLLDRLIPDIHHALDVKCDEQGVGIFDEDQAAPGGIWDPELLLTGGKNYLEEEPRYGHNDPREGSS